MKLGPKYKIARRLGAAVFDKTQGQKFALAEAKNTKKGGKRKQLSEYAQQLLEKQRIRYTYNITEKQFENYVKEALATREGSSADVLRELLEVRLDNVAYRIGLAPTRQASRQLVSHGHLAVNGRKTTVPSYRLKIGDVVSVREGSKKSVMFADIAKKIEKAVVPVWLSFDAGAMTGGIKQKPTKEGAILDFARVLEFYSR